MANGSVSVVGISSSLCFGSKSRGAKERCVPREELSLALGKLPWLLFGLFAVSSCASGPAR